MSATLDPTEAIDRLDPERWAGTSPKRRLELLRRVRENCRIHAGELAAADAQMKNELIGWDAYRPGFSKIATVVPIANTLSACIELYEHMLHGEMPAPTAVTAVDGDRFDVEVSAANRRDRLLNRGRRRVLRVRGRPQQVSPMSKPPGIIAVLGAGNYSSSLEMVKAIFLENCTVVHKPHTLNRATDRVWAEVFQPLVDEAALSFIERDPERILTSDDRLTRIYFTGGTSTATRIMESTDTRIVSECGGNNPCIIVPGSRPWTDAEIEHQANQIVTIAKFNGGAVCGRVQTLVTCRRWPQRQRFLDALRAAIATNVPPSASYYPGSAETFEAFKSAQANAELLEPAQGARTGTTFMLITGAEPTDHAAQNEAFTQILAEVPVDTVPDADEFLRAAVDVANEQLLGTLACAIIVDDTTGEAHHDAMARAVTDLRYGAISINAMPPFIFLDPYLTWGGNEEGQPLVSGRGNFGKLPRRSTSFASSSGRRSVESRIAPPDPRTSSLPMFSPHTFADRLEPQRRVRRDRATERMSVLDRGYTMPGGSFARLGRRHSD